MNTKIEITDEMVQRAHDAYYPIDGKNGTMRHALEAALNPPPVLCKNCGEPKSEHSWPYAAHEPGPRCSASIWNPAS